MNGEQWFHSYIFAWYFWVGLALGLYSLMIVHHCMRGAWSRPLVRIFEAGAKTLPLMGLLFIPIFLARHDLYAWAQPDKVAHDPILQARQNYNFDGFYLGRTIFYFVVWGLFTLNLTRSSRRQEQTGDMRLEMARTTVGAWGIVVHVLLITFASLDWFMSLDPHWYSTMYGGWVMVQQCLLATAFTIVFTMTRFNKGVYTEDLLNRKIRKDISNVLLMFIMVWAYFSLAQFLIIWSGNLPHEISYYYTRDQGGWMWIGAFTLFGQFFLPFVFLLAGRTKRTPSLLLSVACWVIFIRFVNSMWVILPNFRKEPSLTLLDGLCVVVMGLLWGAAFSFFYKSAPPIPREVPAIPEVHEYA